MKTNSRTLILGLSFLVPTLNVQNNKADIHDDFKNTIVTIAAIVTGAAIIKLIIDFSKPTSEKTINKAHDTLRHALTYPEVNIISDFFDLNNMSDLEKRVEIDKVKEGILYKLYKSIYKNATINNYTSSLNNTINNLTNSRNQLSKLLNSPSEDNFDRFVVKDLEIQINQILNKMNFLKNYIENHQAYFGLISKTEEVLKEYDYEFDLLSLRSYEFINQFKLAIRSKGNNIDPKSPFIAYNNVIKSKISELEKSLKKMRLNYKDVLRVSRNSLDNLKTLQENILASEEYSNEHREIEKQNNIKKELELKQEEINNKNLQELEKIRLKEREIIAKEQEVLAREREARAKEKELRLKQQELDLKEREFKRRR